MYSSIFCFHGFTGYCTLTLLHKNILLATSSSGTSRSGSYDNNYSSKWDINKENEVVFYRKYETKR